MTRAGFPPRKSDDRGPSGGLDEGKSHSMFSRSTQFPQNEPGIISPPVSCRLCTPILGASRAAITINSAAIPIGLVNSLLSAGLSPNGYLGNTPARPVPVICRPGSWSGLKGAMRGDSRTKVCVNVGVKSRLVFRKARFSVSNLTLPNFSPESSHIWRGVVTMRASDRPKCGVAAGRVRLIAPETRVETPLEPALAAGGPISGL